MNKKIWIQTIIVVLILAGVTAYLFINLNKQKEENAAIKELAEIDKKEMENEYQQFAQQYSEMKTQINNDSIVAQLTAEQEKTQRLLNELRRVKSTDAIEITRLKKELATVRAVIRSYVMEIERTIRGRHPTDRRIEYGEAFVVREGGHRRTTRCNGHLARSQKQAWKVYRPNR